MVLALFFNNSQTYRKTPMHYVAPLGVRPPMSLGAPNSLMLLLGFREPIFKPLAGISYELVVATILVVGAKILLILHGLRWN